MLDNEMKGKQYYFAYGSNMYLQRLRDRAPSVAAVDGYYTLADHALRFHKRGADGSGKCNAFHTGNSSDIVIGRLFIIDDVDIPELDRHEGLGRGYQCKREVVKDAYRSEKVAFFYSAETSHIDDDLKPTASYKKFVVDGAREGHLPEEYIRKMIVPVETQ